ncbi:MAG TPA: hypothetical protein VIX12_01065 [Candidatus Binataceae bacterium]
MVASVAPAAVGAAGVMTASSVDNATNKDMPGTRDDREDRCDQLARVTPGVEEVQELKDGSIETRQWRLVVVNGAPQWALSPSKAGRADGWEPKPGIAKLNFNPPLPSLLSANKPVFLSYAPSQSSSITDSELMTSVSETFGPNSGMFQWRGRVYGFTLVGKLPCFPVLK